MLAVRPYLADFFLPIMNEPSVGLSGKPLSDLEELRKHVGDEPMFRLPLMTRVQVIDVNLFGVINGIHAFVPTMLKDRKEPGAVVITGSKQCDSL